MIWLLISFIIVLCFVSAWQAMLRQRAEKRLRDAKEEIHLRERKIQTILDNAPIVFSAIDAQGIFHISEGKGLQRLGRKNNQSVGTSIYEMHSHNPIILDAVKKALSGEQVETSFTLKGISYDLFMGPEKNAAGVVTGASMLSVDTTDRKKIEEEKAQLLIREKAALETTKLKSEFLATMSHEIRTPLNGVLGMTSLLLDTDLTPQQKEYAGAIKHSGSGLLGIVNDILDFSKIEAGKLDFEEINFDLPGLFSHILKGLNFIANAKKIDLMVKVAPSVQTWVKGDPGRFRQVLNNLVGNAIKFTEQGYVSVKISAVQNEIVSSSEMCTIRVEVEDTGIGITQDMLDKMFTPFSQGEASMSRRFGGTGLGLSISRQLVEKMGGHIGVSNNAEIGSTFWFEIPFRIGKIPEEIDLQKNYPSTPLVSADGKALQVLVAEDNTINQIITVRMLKKMGFEAHVVADGMQALEALNTSHYDLVLMDCQMPVLDGLEATRQFRGTKSIHNHGVPILAMTANAMKGDKEKCLEAGMDDYVSKPVSYEQLSKAVHLWLQLKRARL